ncbi:hypothetical protein A4X09_0g6919 [Tilletia walkeri]|uniref:Uncharacterized protein n=1 Tax=Tilletia walkeri TaxID=117179 RepID=A0A8X7N2W3_9BASI|nr:hypothetical protein A4X09_0g6919 [Tilletia walkeri]
MSARVTEWSRTARRASIHALRIRSKTAFILAHPSPDARVLTSGSTRVRIAWSFSTSLAGTENWILSPIETVPASIATLVEDEKEWDDLETPATCTDDEEDVGPKDATEEKRVDSGKELIAVAEVSDGRGEKMREAVVDSTDVSTEVGKGDEVVEDEEDDKG